MFFSASNGKVFILTVGKFAKNNSVLFFAVTKMSKDLPFFDVELSLTDDVKLMTMAKEILSKLKPTWHDENIAFNVS